MPRLKDTYKAETVPALMECQNASTVFPMGVTAPRPVTTTRLFIFKSSLRLHAVPVR